jgi:hypothetical protein
MLKDYVSAFEHNDSASSKAALSYVAFQSIAGETE